MEDLSPDRAELVVTGRLVTPNGVRRGAVVVAGGRIRALTDGGDLPAGVPRIDAGDDYVLPGLIDSHVHFRTPGLEYKEDWAHGGRAAVAGGVTTVMDMPNTIPPTLDAAAVAAKAAMVAGTSLVDYRFHLGADPLRPELLAELDPSVATSAKVFMAGHHTAPTVVREPEQLEKIFASAAAGGVQLVLHAEDETLFALLDGWQGAPREYRDYERFRPRSGGIAAVAKVIELVRRHGTKAHILHLSSAEEADLVIAARAAGLPVTFELTAHHLSFTDADTLRLGARTRLSPAIRGRADQDRLWAAFHAGDVTDLGSDHAPHTIAEKTRPVPDAPPGLPGVQELAVAVWTGMRRRWPDEDADTAIARLVEHLASKPADLFGLAGKGRLEPGADADLVVFRPGERWMLTAADLRSKCGWSAYEGWTMTGRVRTTVRGGAVVWDAETETFGEPTGRWLSTRSPVAAPPPQPVTVRGRDLEPELDPELDADLDAALAGVDGTTFRRAMSHLAAPLTVLTCYDAEGRPQGLTVNAVSSLSLDPPLMLVCLDRASRSHDIVRSTGHLCLHLLGPGQEALAMRFASKGDRFRDLPVRHGRAPELTDVGVRVMCRPHGARDGGDHTILLCLVTDVTDPEDGGGGGGLVWHHREPAAVVPPTTADQGGGVRVESRRT